MNIKVLNRTSLTTEYYQFEIDGETWYAKEIYNGGAVIEKQIWNDNLDEPNAEVLKLINNKLNELYDSFY